MLEDDINLYSNYVYKIIDNIIKNTYNKFLNEEIKRNSKKKKIAFVLCICTFLLVGTITVNATTNNGIVNLVKKIININGEEKEAKEYIDKNAYFYD